MSCPILAYGMDSIDLSESDIKHLRTMLGNTTKIVMGVNKYSHHCNLLKALEVPNVNDVIKKNAMRLYRNVFKANTPVRLTICPSSSFHPQKNHHQGDSAGQNVGAGANPLD